MPYRPNLDSTETHNGKNAEWQKNAGGVFRVSNYFSDESSSFNELNQNGTQFTVNATDDSVTYKLVLAVSATYFTLDGTDWDSTYEVDPTGYQSKGLINVSNGVRYFIDLTTNTEETGKLNSFYAYDTATAITKGIIDDDTSLTYTNGFAIVVIDGVNYMIIEKDSSTYINSSVTAYIYAYDANEELIGLKKL